MNIKKQRFEDPLDPSWEEGGYFKSPGAIYGFFEDHKEYRFKIEDSTPTRAYALTALIDDKEVTVMVHEPYGDNKKVIKIPTQCGVFRKTLKELQGMGVRFVGFYNQRTGGFTELAVEELEQAQHRASPARKSAAQVR